MITFPAFLEAGFTDIKLMRCRMHVHIDVSDFFANLQKSERHQSLWCVNAAFEINNCVIKLGIISVA